MTEIDIMEENLLIFVSFRKLLVKLAQRVDPDSCANHLVDERVGNEASYEGWIRKYELVSDREGVDSWVKTSYVDIYDLEVFIPDNHHGGRVVSEADLRVSFLLDACSVFFLIEDHSNLEEGFDEA